MPFVEFYNAGSAGIITDVAAHELPPEAWSDGRNVRFYDGKAAQIEGYTNFDSSICAAPTFCIAVPQQNTTADIWVYTSDSEVYAYTGSANAKLTASTLTATGQNTWSGTVLSGILVLNTQRHKPQYWVFPPNTSTTLSAIPDWSASWTCKVIRSYKNYLVALHTTEGANDYPYRVRWSDAADAGTVPQSWDAADTTNDAGYNDLIEGGDFVIDAAPLGDKLILYKEASTWAMSYIGGTLVFSFTKLFPDVGLISRHAVAPIGRLHFCVGASDVWVHDGFSDPQRILVGRNKRRFYSGMSKINNDKIVCVANQSKSEVWTLYPTTDAGTLDAALIWNWRENTWTFRDVPNLYFGAFGGISLASAADTWDSLPLTWDEYLRTWDPPSYKEDRMLLASRGDSRLYLADVDYTHNGTGFTAYLERRALPLDGTDSAGNPKPAAQATKAVRAVWPRMTSAVAATMNIYVGTQDNPNDTPTWYGPYRYNPHTMRKIDCRVTGRYIAIKFESGDDVGWVLDSYGLDVHRAGRWY